MMMQKQRDKLQADETSLMSEWRTCWQEKHAELFMPHPNRSAKSWTLELEKVLRITGRLEPKNTRNAGIP